MKRLTLFSEAPIYLLRISGPLTEMKFRPHSFATAEANSVFPHPGKPYNNNLRNKSFVSGPLSTAVGDEAIEISREGVRG